MFKTMNVLLQVACLTSCLFAQTISKIPSILDGEPSDRSKVWFALDDLGLGKTRRLSLFHLQNLITGPTFKSVSDLTGVGAGFTDSTVVHVLGYSSTGDGGQGFFYLDASGQLGAGAENSGTIFAATGGTNWYWRRILDSSRIITPQFFGAKGDSTGAAGVGTDDTMAIQNAVDYCDSLNSPDVVKPVLLFPPSGNGYRTTATVTIPENIEIRMQGKIQFDPPADTTPCLVIGATGAAARNFNLQHEIRVRKVTVADWADEGCIGVKFFAHDASFIFIYEASRFTIGFQCMGRGTGFSNNIIHLGGLFDNHIHGDFVSDFDSIGGWVSDNAINGGRIANVVGTHTNDARYGFRLRLMNGSSRPSGNKFYKNTIELHKSDTTAEAIPVLMQDGAENQFDHVRSEDNESIFARCSNAAKNNVFGHFFHEGTVEQLDLAVSNVVIFGGGTTKTGLSRLPLREIFDSGPMHKNAVMYDGTKTHIPNVQFGTSGGSTAFESQTLADFFVSEVFTVDTATDEIIDTAHSRENGDIAYLTTDGALPAATPSLVEDTQAYYVIGKTANRFLISESLDGAQVDITGATTDTDTYHSRNRFVEFTNSSRVIGVNIDTSTAKNFVIVRDNEPTFGGVIRVRAHDSDGVILSGQEDFTVDTATDELITVNHRLVVNDTITFTTTGTLPVATPTLVVGTTYHVISVTVDRFKIAITQGGASVDITGGTTDTDTWTLTRPHIVASTNLFWSTSLGGHWTQGSSIDSDVAIRVRDEVKHITVMIGKGSTNLKIRSFKIYTPDIGVMPEAWLETTSVIKGSPVATQAPTTGVYNKPMMIWNHEPVAGEVAGWSTTTTGTPAGSTTIFADVLGTILKGTVSWDPVNLADGAGETSPSVTVAGAVVGDFVQLSAPYDLEDCVATAYVATNDTVEIRLQNESGAARNAFGVGTWQVRVTKP